MPSRCSSSRTICSAARLPCRRTSANACSTSASLIRTKSLRSVCSAPRAILFICLAAPSTSRSNLPARCRFFQLASAKLPVRSRPTAVAQKAISADSRKRVKPLHNSAVQRGTEMWDGNRAAQSNPQLSAEILVGLVEPRSTIPTFAAIRIWPPKPQETN